jgi:hypothetical protein
MIPEHEDQIQLSEAGLKRREQMLHELLDDLKTVQRRRRIRRNATLTGAPLIVIGTALAIWLMIGGKSALAPPHDSPLVQNDLIEPGTNHVAPPLPKNPRVNVEFVQTDSRIVERYRAAGQPKVVMLDDASLLDALAQINRPAGLIRSQGRAWLTADVTDHRGG